jgi:hypothetical protein
MSDLIITTLGTNKWWNVMSLTFEFLHNYCHKSSSEVYKDGRVYVLKSFSPLCCGFLHLFRMFMFGIINSLLRGRKIC